MCFQDPSSAAGCLHGRLNILKYCKRVYQRENITNIVEYSHLSRISNWLEDSIVVAHLRAIKKDQTYKFII